ncbi:serine/threonine-protein kinase [Streptomyces sp. NPDC060005]|uniref:serine/threonine-protein kinase n=1 Tax=Streptomyces sp. NPDC060005 TaxID=3347034 RepID=UPI0036C58C17
MAMVTVHDSAGELVAGRYLLLDVVLREEGRTCWLGQDSALRRPVVLTWSRVAAPARAGEESAAGSEAAASGDALRGETEGRAADRILRAARVLGAACPGRVAAVLDVIEEPGSVWTVTERPPGFPLTDLLSDGPVGHVRAARVGLGVLDVLAAAHAEGLPHGELGPGQVWTDEFGTVTVTGFGQAASEDAPRLTAPAYASPEQARGEGGAAAADLWALGAMMYAMTEGRPAVRDRGRLDATLRAVDRLPIRAPLRAGPLAPAVQGLLRWDPVERIPDTVVRESLTRILRQDLEEAEAPGPPNVFCGPGTDVGDRQAGARRVGHAPGGRLTGRPVLLGGALVATVAVLTVLAVTGGLPGGDTSGASAATSAPSRSAGALPPGPVPTAPVAPSGRTPSGSPSGSPSSSPSPSGGAGGKLPDGFVTYRAAQGFSVALPRGWKPVDTQASGDLSYRVTFGASGDPRTLAVTYSTQLGPDPVAVWSDLEPALRADTAGYRRVGAIRAVTYRGMKGADMEWYSGSGDERLRTFGRGFLVGGHRGFSLRWTTPAVDRGTTADRRALDAVLTSFRPPVG